MATQLEPSPELLQLQSPRQPIRILHVVESLDGQAVETWLLRVFRAASKDYPNFHWTFFSVLNHDGRHDSLARELGGEVIHSRYQVGDKVRFVSGLRDVMKRGSYDILHCHHDIMSAAYLVASIGLPFKKRIVHLHNTAMSLPTPSRVKAELVREPMRQLCLRMADHVVGISKEALESLIGNGAAQSTGQSVVHYAIDTARFSRASVDLVNIRKQLGITETVKIILFVGRLVEYKNPCFVVAMLEQLAKTDESTVAVFAGMGDQDGQIRQLAKLRSLDHRVHLIGFREDVPELMMAADLLIWPSLEDPMEGLGLGIVEAQAAGLPILMSRSVPEEAIVSPELVTVLPLSEGPETWARVAFEILDRPRPTPAVSLAAVEESSFSMTAGVSNLMALYDLPESSQKIDAVQQ